MPATNHTGRDLNPISSTTREALDRFPNIYAEDYEGYKTEFINWLIERGKRPFKGDGYAFSTTKTTHYKIERVYRWKWRQAESFTKDFNEDDAEAFIDHLVQETTLGDREIRDYIKAINRLFRWFNDTRGADHDWTYSKMDEIEQKATSKRRHYFEQYEMAALYDAAVEYASFPSYHSVTPGERDRLKAVLAERFEMPKSEVGPDAFKRANSWKFPSLMAMSIDLGLRPIEIGRARVNWLRIHDEKVVIPREESSKGDDPWECVLSGRSTNALQRWLEERRGRERYEDTGKLWLTRHGNPYDCHSLRYVMNKLCELTDIDNENRDVTWYSIRHSVGTYMAREAGLAAAQAQRRHKRERTTMKYDQAPVEDRQDALQRMG